VSGAEGAGALAALLIGLVGSVHCLGMCGGIAGALAQSAPGSQALSGALYSVGRISSYALAGAFVGAAGSVFSAGSGTGPALRIVAGLLIVAVALQMGEWWRGIAVLERSGLAFWRRLAPLVRRLGRPDRAWKIFATGLLWGWLPCGLVYSALATASLMGNPGRAAGFMLCFGLGTLPALLLTAGLSGSLQNFIQRRSTRRSAAGLLLVCGLWTLGGATLAMLSHSGGDARAFDVPDRQKGHHDAL